MMNDVWTFLQMILLVFLLVDSTSEHKNEHKSWLWDTFTVCKLTSSFYEHSVYMKHQKLMDTALKTTASLWHYESIDNILWKFIKVKFPDW